MSQTETKHRDGAAAADLRRERGAADRSDAVGGIFFLRPGVAMPDWSQIDGDAARAALRAILDLMGMARKWAELGAAEDRVRRAVLEGYARSGKAPTPPQLAAATGLSGRTTADWLRRLQARDLVVLDADGAITGAYPFTDRDTGYRIRLGDQALNAMCAIDALGAGAMFGRDIGVEAACRHCGRSIRVATREQGRALAEVEPGEAVVWSGFRHADACAATSLCTVLTFFCSDAHLAAWRGAGGGRQATGVRLSMAEGLQVGKAVFMPMLRRPGHAPDGTGGSGA